MAHPDSRAACVLTEEFALLLQNSRFCKWKIQLPNLLHCAQHVEEMGAQLGRNSGICLYRDVEFLMKNLIKKYSTSCKQNFVPVAELLMEKPLPAG